MSVDLAAIAAPGPKEHFPGVSELDEFMVRAISEAAAIVLVNLLPRFSFFRCTFLFLSTYLIMIYPGPTRSKKTSIEESSGAAVALLCSLKRM